MVSTNANALGIIFPNAYDNLIPELTQYRTMASVPFGSRYRMIDFILSSMSNCGISNVSVLVKKNYHSLMDHMGAGREWDLSRKHGGLNIVAPFYEGGSHVYGGRVEALAGIVDFLAHQKEKYVILADSNLAINPDLNVFIRGHVESGADVSMYYQTIPVPEGIRNQNHTLKVNEEGRVVELLTNDSRPGIHNVSMNIYIMDRETLVEMVKDASTRNYTSFERDILARNLQLLHVRGVRYDGYVARICDKKSYYDEHMKLLDRQNLSALFDEHTVYTKVRDDAPTRYAMDCHAKNCLVADGCIIEGDVENCVLFRGVHVKKGAKVRNCVLMQDTVIEAGADVEYIITDKNVSITAGKVISGTDTYPVFVNKGQTV